MRCGEEVAPNENEAKQELLDFRDVNGIVPRC
jgi:hypothetical protein